MSEKEALLKRNLYYLAILPGYGEVDKVLASQGIKNVALYGMGTFGQAFYFHCKKNKLNIIQLIDSKEDIVVDKQEVVKIEELGENIEAVLVSSDFYYDEIRNKIYSLFPDMNVIRLSSLLQEIIMCCN